MLWDVIGWRITSIGGPSGAVGGRCQIKLLVSILTVVVHEQKKNAEKDKEKKE